MTLWQAAGWTAVGSVFADPAAKVISSAVDGVAKASTNERSAYQRGFEDGYRSALKYAESTMRSNRFQKKD